MSEDTKNIEEKREARLEDFPEILPGTPEYKKLKEEAKVRFLSVTDRGVTLSRYHVDVPPHLHGEWFFNSPEEIARAKSMGFVEDTIYAVKSSIHGASRVGDTIHMVQPRYLKEARDEVERQKFIDMHGKPGKKRTTNQKEERDFAEQSELPVVNESSSTVVGLNEIREALQPQSLNE